MHRSFVFTRALLAVIGLLLLVGSQKASAQTIFACKDNTSGSLFFYATSPSIGCGPGRTLETFNLTPGALGASAFSCNIKGGSSLTNGGSLAGNAGNFLVGQSFGSGIGYNNGTTFLLQPGTYLVQLSVSDVFLQYQPQPGGQTAGFVVDLTVNGGAGFLDITANINTIPNSLSAFVAVNGNQLLKVLSANTVIGFTVSFNTDHATTGGCQIVFTQLQ
jgi:hypothetical protein